MEAYIQIYQCKRKYEIDYAVSGREQRERGAIRVYQRRIGGYSREIKTAIQAVNRFVASANRGRKLDTKTLDQVIRAALKS